MSRTIATMHAKKTGLYEVLLEHGPDALLVVEHGQRTYRVVNAAAESLLGFTRAELLELGPEDVTDPAQTPSLAEVLAHLSVHGWWRGEWRLRRKDGTVVSSEATIARVVVAGRVFIQGLFRERWLEAALLKAIDVQHELNNQLALTTGYAELLADNPRLPADLLEAAREALVGGLGAVDAGKRLIGCFTRPVNHASATGAAVGNEKENVVPLPTVLSAHRRPP